MDPAQRAGQVHRTLFPLRTPCFTGALDTVLIANLSGARCFATRSPLFPLPLMGASLSVGGVHILRLSGWFFVSVHLTKNAIGFVRRRFFFIAKHTA